MKQVQAFRQVGYGIVAVFTGDALCRELKEVSDKRKQAAEAACGGFGSPCGMRTRYLRLERAMSWTTRRTGRALR